MFWLEDRGVGRSALEVLKPEVGGSEVMICSVFVEKSWA